MKNFLQFALKATYVFFLVIGSLFITGLVLVQSVKLIDDQVSNYETFSVDGYAKKKVQLDTASINLGVRLEGSDTVKLQKEASEKYNLAIAKIKEAGISEDDIQTQNYSVSSRYNYETNKTDGYEVNLSIIVTIQDTRPESSLLSDVINKASEAGFNQINNLNFYLEDYQKVQDEIKNEAIQDAKTRAEKEAEQAGIKLGKVINMYTGSSQPYYYDSYAKSDVMEQAPMASRDAEIPDIQIHPGQTEVEVSVTLVYEIK